MSTLQTQSNIQPFDRWSRLIDELLPPLDELRTGWRPHVDVKETDEAFIFYADVPGIDPKDIEVEVLGDTLTLSGKREFSNEERADDYIRRERCYDSFHRRYALTTAVAEDKVVAEVSNGVLKVTAPKVAQAAPHKVTVTVD